jgi:hypothetical protein
VVMRSLPLYFRTVVPAPFEAQVIVNAVITVGARI